MIVFPEGVMLNYLLRLRDPLPTFDFVPPALAFYGVDKILGGIAAHPPDLMVILSRDIGEFGSPVFVFDDISGRQILLCIDANYEVAANFGGNPLDPRSVGVVVLRRKAHSRTDATE